MCASKTEISLDVREIAREYFTVHVQYKGAGFFRLGLFLIKLGCRIGGFNFVDEIPASVFDSEGKLIERKEK